MTVKELLDKLSACKNLNAEVKIRHGWESMANHYTLGLVEGGDDEPVLVATWATDTPELDTEAARPGHLPDIGEQ